jgi:hypothetical protein
MALEKMTIIAYKDSKFTEQVGDNFQVYINPERYTHTYGIDYKDEQAQGSNGPSPVFNKYKSDTVNFELVFDGTGVVPSPRPGNSPASGNTVEKQIGQFKKLAFSYNGNIHRPNFLMLSWGTLLFKCVLTTLNLTYTLFMPDGTPLRAKATTTFIGFNDEVELALKANKSSPDLPHVLTVKAGDTLPLMCYDIYGSSAYYPQVAHINGLTNMRNLVEGTKLLFPPLGAAAP